MLYFYESKNCTYKGEDNKMKVSKEIQPKVIKQVTDDFSEALEIQKNLWRECKNLHSSDYGERGVRVSEWIPPKGYCFQQFYQNGVSLEVLKPSDPEEVTDKVILMVHGGSFNIRMTDLFIDPMAYYSIAGKNATVVSVDYRVRPDVTFNQMIQDVVNAYEWILSQGYEPQDIIAAGDSSGGGTVLGTMLYLRDHKLPMPGGIITISASTNLTTNPRSVKTVGKKDLMFGDFETIRKRYVALTQGENATDPYVSPYFGDFTGFPPMLIQVGSGEILLEDSVGIAKKAYRQGVDVTLEIYESMYHGFQMCKGKLKEADLAWENMSKFMDEVFQKDMIENAAVNN